MRYYSSKNVGREVHSSNSRGCHSRPASRRLKIEKVFAVFHPSLPPLGSKGLSAADTRLKASLPRYLSTYMRGCRVGPKSLRFERGPDYHRIYVPQFIPQTSEVIPQTSDVV